jgi:hypothetical protein
LSKETTDLTVPNLLPEATLNPRKTRSKIVVPEEIALFVRRFRNFMKTKRYGARK